jgi:transcriptional regulator with XRE-family HTH domain
MQATMTDALIRQSISTNLRRLLAEKNRTQTFLSAETGDPLTTINGIVNGKCVPNVGTLQRIAETLEVKVDDLLEPAGQKSRRA